MKYKTFAVGRRALIFVILVVAIGIFGLQSVTKAALINADQVLGQLDINGNPSFTQGNADSSIVNDYGFDRAANMVIDDVRHRLFVADTGNNRVLVFNLSDRNIPLDFKIGDFQADYVLGQNNFSDNLPNQGQGLGSPNNSTLWLPGGLAYDYNRDVLYVADRGNNRVLAYDVSSISNGEPATDVVATVGNQSISFSIYIPVGLAIDSRNEKLFLSDSGHHRVLVYDLRNYKEPVAVLGQSDFTSFSSGLSAANLNYPTALAFNESNNTLYVADAGNFRILAFDLSSGVQNGQDATGVLGQYDFDSNSINFQNAMGVFGLGNSVSSMSVDPATNLLYVPVSTQNRVMVFDVSVIDNGEDAVYVLGQNNFTSIGSNQYGHVSVGTLSEPTGAALTGGYLYVADSENNRIVIYDTQTIVNGEDAVEVLGQLDGNGMPSFAQNKINSSNVNNHGFNYNWNSGGQYGGSDVDTIHHRLFVSDKENNRVLIFNLDGSNNLVDHAADNVLGQADLITGTANRGGLVAADTLRKPSDVAYDEVNNRLYVADSGNSRVLIYDVSGDVNNGEPAVFVLGQINFTMFGSPVHFNETSLSAPQSLTLDSTRNILYVSDTGYNRILAYDVSTITDGESAISVLGQPDFVSNADNGGALATANIFSGPYGLAHDSARQLLYVTDSNNSRVLVYDVMTIANGEPAVHVLGQSDFTSNSVSLGTSNGLAVPTDVAYNKNSSVLYVSDRNNQRVLAYDTVSITDGEAATAVLGQIDFSTSNQSQISASSLLFPYGLTYNATNDSLFVADIWRHRFLGFNNMLNLLPTALPNGTVGFPYNKVINPAFNNRGTLTYTVSNGSFPPGLSLNPVTRVISGIPNAAGTFIFTVTAKDTLANGEFFTASKQFTIVVIASNGPANLNIISCADGNICADSSTDSKILAPQMNSVQLGKWKFAAANGDVSLRKLTLQVVNPVDNSALTNLGTFGTLSLYDGATLLATGNYINSNVVFSGFNSVIPNGGFKTYTLRGNTNSSGVFSSNKLAAFVVKSDSMVDIQARDAADNPLTSATINYNAVTNNGPAEFKFARATVYNFHDAFPSMFALSLGNSLPLDIRAKIFKFTITNSGVRDLRVGGMNISVNISGLGQGGIGQGGSISDFRLYEDNGMGALGMYLAQNNVMVGNTVNPVNILFDQNNDQNSLLSNFIVAPGSTRTFIMTANTTGIFTSGVVRVSPKILGVSGWNGVGWNMGNLFYFYTPVQGNEQGQFSASDSYGILGQIYAGDLTYAP